ncbi:MAG TPA: DNA repair protein RadC [Dongiaceae bacterium]|jgi:DNA repair protein RadC|nr:DNA repair protein RadC [Dongiaceae bacterium]
MPDSSPHYAGHRERLRDRFLRGGTQALADYEVLELLLFLAKPRGDVKPLAKELIRRFGGFGAVMAAPPIELEGIKGVGDTTVAAIKIVQAAAHLMQRQELDHRPVLDTWDALIGYCHSIMAHERIEQFRLIFLNGKNSVIADELQQRGTIDHTPVYVREVVKRALELGASALVMVHNHPTGDPKPSREDIQITQTIRQALEKVDIRLYDHIIIGRHGHASLRSLGLIEKR